MRKNLLKFGTLSLPWWIVSLAIFAALEPGYSHLYNAVSRLGAFGASNALAMNIVCFLGTGLLVCCAGLGFRSELQSRGYSDSAANWTIVLGLMLAGAAVPADFQQNFQSPWTVIHAFFVMLAVIPFLIAASKTTVVLQQMNMHSKFLKLWPWLIVPVFCLHALLQQRGLVQRLSIVVVLTWVSYLSWHLAYQTSYHNSDSNSPA
ncbi:DUF998 domain-containing protein [Undibacterium cyanobacteriorum]|uniref:DUF998 domain-containing protein n=1 Tax=Undibacterium cyanobacteriorum TaxID=3073561 RepID=A0ABY9RM95_9BURK|nr:DUF998 domain-containing protein [Undibacterium sp. 20NA77.5]WMW81810.1 DUF998 domain-containing protein [Undibacterium sp. 20NA77.5]